MRKLNGRLFVLALALILCQRLAAAQEAYKIDEIKNPRCDLSEVPPIDPPPYGKFATALYNNPEWRGAVVVYGLEGDARIYAADVKKRLVRFSAAPAERLVTVYGGHTEERLMELWIIPKGAAEPKPNYVEDTKSARKFDVYIYWNADYCAGGRGQALVTFAEALKRRPGWHGYVVVRPHRNTVRAGDEDWDPDGYVSRREALRRATKDKLSLVKAGVPPAQIKAVVGGKDTWTHAELWLVPPGAEPPSQTK